MSRLPSLTECYEPVILKNENKQPVPPQLPSTFHSFKVYSRSPLIGSLGETVLTATVDLKAASGQRAPVLECSVMYSGHLNGCADVPDALFLSNQLRTTLEGSILSAPLSKNTVVLQILILQAAGGELTAAIIAANLIQGMLSPIQLAANFDGLIFNDPSPQDLKDPAGVLQLCRKGGADIAQLSLTGRRTRSELVSLLQLADAAVLERKNLITQLLRKL